MTEAEHAHCLAYALRNVLSYPDSQNALELAQKTLIAYFSTPHPELNNVNHSNFPG
jgi:hypothetical protein